MYFWFCIFFCILYTITLVVFVFFHFCVFTPLTLSSWSPRLRPPCLSATPPEVDSSTIQRSESGTLEKAQFKNKILATHFLYFSFYLEWSLRCRWGSSALSPPSRWSPNPLPSLATRRPWTMSMMMMIGDDDKTTMMLMIVMMTVEARTQEKCRHPMMMKIWKLLDIVIMKI